MGDRPRTEDEPEKDGDRVTSTSRPAPREKRMTLANISRSPKREPDRIFIYGIEKVGKSTFGANAPKPVFISAESGLAEIDPPPAHFPEIRDFQDVLDAVETLTNENHEFKTLVVDSLDWVAHLVQDVVCKRLGWNAEKFAAYGKGFEIAMDDWRKLRMAFDRLQDEKGVEIILVAHAEAKPFDDPTGASFVRYRPKMGGNVAPAYWKEWAKSVLFARHEYSTKAGEGFSKGKATSTGRRIIHTTWNAAFDAGNRYSLPDVIALDYAEYAEHREAKRPASPDALRAEATNMIESIKDETTRNKASEAVKAAGDNAISLAKIVDRLRTKIAEQEST